MHARVSINVGLPATSKDVREKLIDLNGVY